MRVLTVRRYCLVLRRLSHRLVLRRGAGLTEAVGRLQ
jgi:hypothetical protein